MANVTAKIPLDNFVQNGDQTLAELMAAVAAVNGGNNPSVTEIVRDPATGRLIQVILSFPASIGQAAIDAINANPGVPATLKECPQQIFANELSDATPDGIVYSGSFTTDGQQTIGGQGIPSGLLLGVLTDTGSGNTYTDLAELLSAEQFIIEFINRSTTTDLVIAAASTLTINFSATLSVDISLSADLTIPKKASTLGFANLKRVYVDVDGKVYLRQQIIAQVVGPVFSYDEACQGSPL